MNIIQVENLIFSYDKQGQQKPTINNLSFNVKKGEYLAIVGHNGSGKSTLAKLLNGLLTPDSGSVMVEGFSTLDKKSLFEIRKRVGVVFQNPDNQIVASIVEDDVAFGPENLGVPRKEIGERIDYALQAVDMQAFRNKSPMHLSGGQKQRIAIAGVLALKPQVLVLDESTAMLDPVGRREVLQAVKKLNKETGVTVIAITHYMEEVVDADRVIVLSGGEIVKKGKPSEIFSARAELKGLGLEIPMPAYLAEKLRESGIPLSESILDRESLAEALCKL